MEIGSNPPETKIQEQQWLSPATVAAGVGEWGLWASYGAILIEEHRWRPHKITSTSTTQKHSWCPRVGQ